MHGWSSSQGHGKAAVVKTANLQIDVKPDDSLVTIPLDKGFDPSLFDCIDTALTTTLGKITITTFYYAIQEKNHLLESEFPKKPNEVILHLKEILGEVGFRVLERPIIAQIRQTFEIAESVHDLKAAIELAKRNYLKASL